MITRITAAVNRRNAAVRVILMMLLLAVTASAQTRTTPGDGQTPLAIEPGAPAGAYALSGFDNVNLYNGNLNFRLPLMQIGGRGAAQMTMTLPIELHWQVHHWSFPGIPPIPPTESDIPMTTLWTPIRPGYGPGVMIGRRAGMKKYCGTSAGFVTAYTLTRLSFIAPDGTEYELRDQATQGKPYDVFVQSCQGFVPNNYRAPTFVSADGSAMTFISDSSIYDGDGQPFIIYPSGYLILRDGSRLRIDQGTVTWIRDRNGNQLSFSYDLSQRVTSITDSLNRQVTVSYWDPQQGIWYDQITFKGYQGAVRTIQVWYTNLQSVLRSGTAQGSSGYTLKTMNQLFPDLNGATGDYNNPWVVSQVKLPDNRQYKFFYNDYSDLARVELPTGGAYEYDYTPGSGVIIVPPPPSGTNYTKHIYRRVIERRVYHDGTTLERKTSYTATVAGGLTTVDVTHRNLAGTIAAQEKHYFNGSATASFNQEPIAYAFWQDGKEYSSEAYDTNGALLRQADQTFAQREPVPWWSTWQEPTGGEPPNDVRLTEAITTLKDVSPNLVTKQAFGYDIYNNRTDTWEYDFGSGAPPTHPTRHTHTDFLTTNNGTNYATNTDIHLRSLPWKQFVYSVNTSTGAETEASKTEFEYDKYDTSAGHADLIARPDISGLDSTFLSTAYNKRGNMTETRRWLDTTATWIKMNQQYDVAGNVLRVIDARGYATDFSFNENFGGPDEEARTNTIPGELSAIGKSSYAFPTSETNALGHTTYTQYDYHLSRAVDAEDEKGVISSGYYNDALDRPTQLIGAVNVASHKHQTTYTYADASRMVTTSSDQNSYGDNQSKTVMVYDGLGRQVEGREHETASTYIAKQQKYDVMGRVNQMSNPFRTDETNFLWTTSSFDGLGRVKTVTTPDSAILSTTYSGNKTTVTDQALKKRRTDKDALGRITKAVEDPTGLGYETTYTYNALDKLKTVTQIFQSTTQTRNYLYDTLGRLTQSTIPEQTGSTSYTYDVNSNVYTVTDPNGAVITNTYDSINRITLRDYTGTTPDVDYGYDSSSVSYSKGELTSITSSVSSYTYDGYDALGRITRTTQTMTAEGQSYPISYTYDLAGNMRSQIYPSGRVITINYDPANRVIILGGQKAAEQPTTYASQITYTAHEVVKQMKLGNGLWEHTDSNNRLQLKEIGLGTSAADSSKLKLEFGYGTTNNNGNVLTQKITIGGTIIDQAYSYDGLNRIWTAQESQNSVSKWTQTYGYDRFANRTSLVNSGSQAALLPTQSTPTVNSATNRLQGFTYDNSGNVKGDGTGNSFTYDADDRQLTSIVAGISASYSYDGQGRRVKKSSGGITTIYVYSFDGKLIAEYTNPTQIAQPGGTAYLTPDHLGSTRAVTDRAGNIRARHDYLPFGEELDAGIAGRTTQIGYTQPDSTRQRFTSKERDSESKLDFFGARYYASHHGRFTSVDPAMGSAVLSLPQSWNRYAYVLNNPLNIIDPDGMLWVAAGGYLYWDNNEGLTEAQAVKKYGTGARIIPYGTIMVITGASRRSPWKPFVGRMVVLATGGEMLDYGPVRPVSPVEINFWTGYGQQFLAAYFRFAAENVIGALIGAAAVRALQFVYQLAKAKKVAEPVLKVLSGYCFVAGTKVVTSNGEKPIEELKVGELVLASDPECGEGRYRRVVKRIRRTGAAVLDIYVGDTVISCTPEHPFWVEGSGWVAAGDLVRGSPLVTKDGKVVRVEWVSRREGQFEVYNIEVEQLHTYYVSNLAVLVHNANCAAGGGGAIGFAPGTASSALTPDRIQHASRHLTEAGILSNWSKATGRKFVDLATKILENPTKSFDHVLTGGFEAKGFSGVVNGYNVVVFVFKTGEYAGKVATAIVPTAIQAAKWGL
jgi:RHS repeat-associated protein